MTDVAYEVHVQGVLTDEIRAEIGDVRIVRDTPMTVLVLDEADQAALHGLIVRLQALGLELVEVRRVAGIPRQLPPETER